MPFKSFFHAMELELAPPGSAGAVRELLPVTKPRGIDKTSVDASPCLEGVCSGVVLFEDVPPACPLSRVLNEEDESCERALTKQWTMEVAAPAYKEC